MVVIKAATERQWSEIAGRASSHTEGSIDGLLLVQNLIRGLHILKSFIPALWRLLLDMRILGNFLALYKDSTVEGPVSTCVLMNESHCLCPRRPRSISTYLFIPDQQPVEDRASEYSCL